MLHDFAAFLDNGCVVWLVLDSLTAEKATFPTSLSDCLIHRLYGIY